MNTIYKKTTKKHRKVKTFDEGKIEDAMNFGWKLARQNKHERYFIITENNRCLTFNIQIIL
jgi:hypothetical protein